MVRHQIVAIVNDQPSRICSSHSLSRATGVGRVESQQNRRFFEWWACAIECVEPKHRDTIRQTSSTIRIHTKSSTHTWDCYHSTCGRNSFHLITSILLDSHNDAMCASLCMPYLRIDADRKNIHLILFMILQDLPPDDENYSLIPVTDFVN